MAKASSHSIATSALQLVILLALLASIMLFLCSWRLREEPCEVTLPETLNPNHAELARLVCLPGVGPLKAHAIIEYRIKCETQGTTPAYTCGEDLLKVKGIGPGILNQISPYLRFDPRPGDE